MLTDWIVLKLQSVALQVFPKSPRISQSCWCRFTQGNNFPLNRAVSLGSLYIYILQFTSTHSETLFSNKYNLAMELSKCMQYPQIKIQNCLEELRMSRLACLFVSTSAPNNCLPRTIYGQWCISGTILSIQLLYTRAIYRQRTSVSAIGTVTQLPSRPVIGGERLLRYK